MSVANPTPGIDSDGSKESATGKSIQPRRGAGGADSKAVERAIFQMVTNGEMEPGDRLGSERELAERFGVTRFILRRALDALERAGTVRRLPGRGGGTFIRQAKVERDLSHLIGFPEYLNRQGFEASTNVISVSLQEANEVAADRLHIAPSDPVFSLVRIRLADGSPISLEHGILPAERFPNLLEQPLGGSVTTLLRTEYGIFATECTERIEVVKAGIDEARLLGIPAGSSLLSIERVTSSQDGQPFEFSIDLFRADRTCIIVTTIGSDKDVESSEGRTEVRLNSL